MPCHRDEARCAAASAQGRPPAARSNPNSTIVALRPKCTAKRGGRCFGTRPLSPRRESPTADAPAAAIYSATAPPERPNSMAKFTPGPMVAAVSGSIGGTVFSRNRGGAYTRNRAIPITSTTADALAAKARLGSISGDWQGLTAGERDSWKFWADANPINNTLGMSIRKTGQQAFVGLNIRLALAAAAAITDPPIVTAPNALLTALQDADIGLGDTDLTYTATPLGASEQIWLQAAVTSSAGIEYVTNLLRFAGVSAAAQASPFDDQSIIEARIGTLVVGQTLHVFASVFDNATGLLSKPLRSDVVVSTT